jgi:hypothetical protein
MVTAAIRSRSHCPVPTWHEKFLAVLPAVHRRACIVFRRLNPEARAEAIQNAICNACAAVARLAELDKLDLVYPSVLANYAVAQTRDGRMLGRPLNCKDISSAYCQRVKGVVLERLDHYDRDEEAWQEILVPDRTCTPAELAASRIDFPGWLDTFRRRERKIAMTLAGGETTSRTARKFHISSARVSQIRRQLQDAWHQYQGESLTRVPVAVSA